MDYVSRVQMTVHEDLAALFGAIGADPFFLTTGLEITTAKAHWEAQFAPTSWILFGKESAGLPAEVLKRYPEAVIRIPMDAGERGLNIATAAGIVLYEALRQTALKP